MKYRVIVVNIAGSLKKGHINLNITGIEDNENEQETRAYKAVERYCKQHGKEDADVSWYFEDEVK